MPSLIRSLLFAIVAGDVDYSCHVGGDWLEGNSHGHGRPSLFHLIVCFGGLFAYGTSGVEGCELFEAVYNEDFVEVSKKDMLRC